MRKGSRRLSSSRRSTFASPDGSDQREETRARRLPRTGNRHLGRDGDRRRNRKLRPDGSPSRGSRSGSARPLAQARGESLPRAPPPRDRHGAPGVDRAPPPDGRRAEGSARAVYGVPAGPGALRRLARPPTPSRARGAEMVERNGSEEIARLEARVA